MTHDGKRRVRAVVVLLTHKETEAPMVLMAGQESELRSSFQE